MQPNFRDKRKNLEILYEWEYCAGCTFNESLLATTIEPTA
jgi:hypothetical protein